MQVVFDLDDYSLDYNCLDELIELKKEIPNLKVTLFTIPAMMNQRLYEETMSYDWIEMALHGYDHLFPSGSKKGQLGSHEFAFLDYDEAKELILKGFDERYYVKGFRAPGWQINEEVMRALKDLGFWSAIQYKDDRYHHPEVDSFQPIPIEGLKHYAMENTDGDFVKIHGHTWACSGNTIEDLKPKLLQSKDLEFITINQFIKQKYE